MKNENQFTTLTTKLAVYTGTGYVSDDFADTPEGYNQALEVVKANINSKYYPDGLSIVRLVLVGKLEVKAFTKADF